jgi:two-component system, cell cycle sensor histidine kinase and response regulator CckA
VHPIPASHRSPRFSLAEDEATVREFLRTILEAEGYPLLVAEDGQTALELAHKHPDGVGLLISNVQMPGMTGSDLAKELKRSHPDLRILLISGYSQGLLMLDKGWNFLQKPFLPKANSRQDTPGSENPSG